MQNSVQSFKTAETCKIKLQLASEGSFQAIQQLKQHILVGVDQSHPIFQQSFYDILQQGYQIKQIKKLNAFNRKIYDMFVDLPMIFLISGGVQIRCINTQGDTEVVENISQKGIIEVNRGKLIEKFGKQNINILTGFQVVAKQDSIILQILGKNKFGAINSEQKSEKQIFESKKQALIMSKFSIIPCKQVVRVKMNEANHNNIKDRLYLLSGKACYYLDDQEQIGQRVILACYTQGYINPKQYPVGILPSEPESNIDRKQKISPKKKPNSSLGVPNSFSAIGRSSFSSKKPLSNIKKLEQQNQIQPTKQKLQNSQQNPQNKQPIKLLIFQQSQIMYFQEQFIRDEYTKSLQTKREQHLTHIIQKYKETLKEQNGKQKIWKIQQKIISKFRLPRRVVDSVIYKIVQKYKQKQEASTSHSQKKMVGRFSSTDKNLKVRNQLSSTASSVKCNIRIRKSKKIIPGN